MVTLATPTMPLLDHFHPPLSRTHPWRSFHGAWAASIARLLNSGVLPPGYYAVPFLDHDGPVEIDIATLREPERLKPGVETGGDMAWSPVTPVDTVVVEWPTIDDVSVQILSDESDPRLAAAIELVSPRNKDRIRAREAFAAKCAGHLRRGCGLVVVDSVTTRRADLHAELLAALGAWTERSISMPMSAVSYRPAEVDGEGRLLVWPTTLQVGQVLPTLPLWLAPEAYVPLDLESSYAATCDDLRIRQLGIAQ